MELGGRDMRRRSRMLDNEGKEVAGSAGKGQDNRRMCNPEYDILALRQGLSVYVVPPFLC